MPLCRRCIVLFDYAMPCSFLGRALDDASQYLADDQTERGHIRAFPSFMVVDGVRSQRSRFNAGCLLDGDVGAATRGGAMGEQAPVAPHGSGATPSISKSPSSLVQPTPAIPVVRSSPTRRFTGRGFVDPPIASLSISLTPVLPYSRVTCRLSPRL